VFEAEYEKNVIKIKEEADAVVNACKGKNGEIESIETKKFQQDAAVAFRLGSLQSELTGFLGIRRCALQQSRSGCTWTVDFVSENQQPKLPPAIGYETILRN